MSQSQGGASTSAAHAPTTSSAAEQNQQWAKFYLQACALLTVTKDKLGDADTSNANENENATTNEEMTKLHQRIMITLDTITKLIFGLGATRKAQVVVHGGGAIELIVALVRTSHVLNAIINDNQNENEETISTASSTVSSSSTSTTTTPLSKPIIFSSLKAIKTCVLRNPAGRCRCRSAGVFSFLKDILDVILAGEKESKDAEDKMLVEQLFTALAAICLGDDVNALQASTQFKPYMERTKTIFSEANDDRESSLDQKILYLERLFTSINQQESKLVNYLQTQQQTTNNNNNKTDNNDEYETFIQNTNSAEKNIRYGYANIQSKNYKQAENHYNLSMKLISPYLEYTKLFHPLEIEIRIKRARVYHELKLYDKCLLDTTYLLEQERLGESAPMITITVLKLHSKALIAVGRDDEASESLGKLKILSPDDAEVMALMEKMKL